MEGLVYLLGGQLLQTGQAICILCQTTECGPEPRRWLEALLTTLLHDGMRLRKVQGAPGVDWHPHALNGAADSKEGSPVVLAGRLLLLDFITVCIAFRFTLIGGGPGVLGGAGAGQGGLRRSCVHVDARVQLLHLLGQGGLIGSAAHRARVLGATKRAICIGGFGIRQGTQRVSRPGEGVRHVAQVSICLLELSGQHMAARL
mmetsp:Transcript_51489/g.111699  ORF Transcript_51489/g.111699 Transcript_51489/m.111699 type:complete len:202 (-) Transcript_51489:493-1098(-)